MEVSSVSHFCMMHNIHKITNCKLAEYNLPFRRAFCSKGATAENTKLEHFYAAELMAWV